MNWEGRRSHLPAGTSIRQGKRHFAAKGGEKP
jgi:hypothetical protein